MNNKIALSHFYGGRIERFSRTRRRCRPRRAGKKSSSPAATIGFTPATSGFAKKFPRYGDLYVIVGHDANIRSLKGEGHPLLPQDERRYVVGSIKFVKQALISSGDGWLDADPEIQAIEAGHLRVNEDGDKGGKREYCERTGIEYLVLKRTPAPGLPKRSSTDLRGF